MQIELMTGKAFEVKTLFVDAEVRYWEDATVNGVDDEDGDLIPCRNGDKWQPVIDVETGKITNWEQGKEASIYYKVCDQGEYWLQDADGGKVVKARGEYVPDLLAIDDRGYGDYIIMTVDKNGMIKDWRFDLNDFTGKEHD